MKISDILRYKGNAVHTISPEAAISDLLRTLAEHHIGAIVVSEAGQPRGIVSERDVVRRLADHGATLLDQSVSSIMTTALVTCTSDDTVVQAATTMTERRIRHMPVVDSGQLVGIVSIGDVVSSRIRELEHDRGHLEHYITG